MVERGIITPKPPPLGNPTEHTLSQNLFDVYKIKIRNKNVRNLKVHINI